MLYLNGAGVEQNIKIAQDLMPRSTDNNYKPTIEWLARRNKRKIPAATASS
jgi:hypothetical protein